MGETPESDDKAYRDFVELYRSAVNAARKFIEARGGIIISMDSRFDVYGRVAGPDGEFEKPRLSILVNYRVDGNVTTVSFSIESWGQWFKDLTGELAAPRESDNGSHFSGIGSKIP